MKEAQIIDFSTVLASSVHDMKNSLSMLLNSIEEITQECQPGQCPTIQKFLLMQYEGQRVNNHLMQLLSIYKIDNKQYTGNIANHSVADFLEECALLHQPLLSSKGIEIETRCDESLLGFFDRDLVAGVINNVVNNAYRYSKDRIRLSGAAQNDYVVIAIEDNGRGYPAHMLCRDSNEPSGINFESGSTGLGLYFSAMVARMHNNKQKTGFISCSNDGLEGGGRFSIYLP